MENAVSQVAQGPSIVCIGECMVEMAPLETPNHYVKGYAGDTFNCAWHIKNSMKIDGKVGYFTALGADQVSQDMLSFLASSGLNVEHVRSLTGRSVGLYMIHTEAGERSFSYFRKGSAATQLAADLEQLTDCLADYRWAYVSGITLAILSPEHRKGFLKVLRSSDTKIAFDINYRPALWSSETEARAAAEEAGSISTIALPSFDDERALFGDETPRNTAQRYARYGVDEVVVSDGEGDLFAWEKTQGDLTFAAPPALSPLDTTGAGDSFNAGYLATRLAGGTMQDAVNAGQMLASRVIMTRGAIF